MEELFVHSDLSVGEVLSAGPVPSIGIGVVVNESGSLESTIYDCDLRKAVMEGLGLDQSIGQFHGDTREVLHQGHTAQEAKDLMRRSGLTCVLVVENNRAIGLCRITGPHVAGATQPGATGVVMAGGRGERLRPLTETVPKPLLPMGKSTIVEQIIEEMVASQIEGVVVTTGYLAHSLEEYLHIGEHLGCEISYIRESSPLGTAGSLSLLPPRFGGPFVVVNGDVVTAVSLSRVLEYHRATGSCVTVAASEHRMKVPYGVIQADGSDLREIVEKPIRTELCSAGIYVLDERVVALLDHNERIDMPDLIARSVAAGLPAKIFPVVEPWFDVGDVANYETALTYSRAGGLQ